MNPIDALERELVTAAARGRARRRMPRRTLLLAAALVVLVAVPAWATGLLRNVFPQSPPPNFGPGIPTGNGQRDYLVASGTTKRGERWRVTIEKNNAIQQDGRRGPSPKIPHRRFDCYSLAIGPPPQAGGGACIPPGMANARSSIALDGVTTGRVSRHDHRTLVSFVTPRQDDRLAVTLRGGRRFFVQPLRLSQAKLRRTGLYFPFGVVAFTIPRGDGLRGIAILDVHGRTTATFMRPARVPASAPTIKSPSL
jgi:hypothetical protein